MDSHQNRSRFTVVEVLVVVVILVMLVCLLLPAIHASRGIPRQVTCMDHQRQIAVALQSCESAKMRFPGYVNRLKTRSQASDIRGSWAVMLLPYLQRTDLWRSWREGQPVYVSMRRMICPQDQPKQTLPDDTPLSYVANCGRPGDEDTAADGIFHNHDVDGKPIVSSMSFLSEHDGASYTLLFSENIQAGRWTDTTEANVGMVWREKPDQCSRINQCLDVGDRPQDIRYARPSSHHGAGVVVSFCNGHQKFLRDTIDYQVYQHLMTPDSKAAGVSGEFDAKDLE